MKSVLLVIAVVLATVTPAEAPAQERWSVTPGALKKMAKELFPERQARVTGTFTFAADNVSGIESNKLGGACLVADLTAQGIGRGRCETDDDCNTPLGVESAGQSQQPQAGPRLPSRLLLEISRAAKRPQDLLG